MLLNNRTFRRFSTLGLLAGLLALGACGGGSKEAQKEDSLIASLLDESSDSLEAQSLDDQASYKVSNLNLIYRLSQSDIGTIRGEMNYSFSIPGEMNPVLDMMDIAELEKGSTNSYVYSFTLPFVIPLEGLRINPADIKESDKKRVKMEGAMNATLQSKPDSYASTGGSKRGAADLMSIFTGANAVKSPKGRTYYRSNLQGMTVEGFISARNQPDMIAYFLIREPGRGTDGSYLLKITAQK